MKKTSGSKKASPAKKTVKKKLPSEIAINRRQEWRFDLPLSTLIRGKLPQGKEFKEKTVLKNISSGGAYFSLDSGLCVGSKVNLVIDLPKELTGEKRQKLLLGGITVRLEKPNARGKTQGVAVRFSKNFQFIPENPEKQE